MTLRDLPQRWRELGETLAPFAPPAAEAFKRCADDLAAQLNGSVDVVTLKEASLIGGYSVDHLQRVVAEGTIENLGKKGAPRLRRSDVPKKPGYVLPTDDHGDQLSPRRRIVREALTHPQRSA